MSHGYEPLAQGLPPAGWYPNPEGPGQRYWDGSQWGPIQPRPPGQIAARQTDTGLRTAGFVFAVLFPIVGIVIGIVLLAKNRVNQGLQVIAVSLVIGALSALILYGA